MRRTAIALLAFAAAATRASAGDFADREIIGFSPDGTSFAFEEYGVEDPRITLIGDTYYITYVAVSRHGVSTALASTRDFKSFSRHGIIFCPENKDVMLFPEMIEGSYYALHRPNGATAFTKPEMARSVR